MCLGSGIFRRLAKCKRHVGIRESQSHVLRFDPARSISASEGSQTSAGQVIAVDTRLK